MQLKLGCLKLQEATEMEEILFWGKIIGRPVKHIVYICYRGIKGLLYCSGDELLWAI